MSYFASQRSTVNPAESAKRSWLRYFLQRNVSKSHDYVSSRLEQFGHTSNDIALIFEVKDLMLNDSASIRSNAYRRVQLIQHRVSLDTINMRNPKQETSKT
jgi:hypothetical protein